MINLYKPYMPDALPELDEILHSGALAYGKWGRRFEQSIQNFVGCSEKVLLTNSFTTTIFIALAAIGIKSGDEIIASPQSCLASTQPLVAFGTRVVWADVDPNRGTLCPESVENKITSRTKAIFHNHYCSYPGYIDEINAIGRKHGLLVIDDCIEAFGSTYKGRMLGNLGTDVTIFSFQTVRLPNTIDGGGIIFKNKEHYEKATRIRDLGIERKTFRDVLGEINPLSDVPITGYGATLSDVNSYIGYCQMQSLPELFTRQRENANVWAREIMEKYPNLKLLNTTDIAPSYWIFGILTNDKQKTLNHFRNLGYGASGVHIPNTYYSIFGSQGRFPRVEEFYSKFLALPSGWWVSNMK
ncbi:MAG: aminotransferase class V-fold PLP-dependent enzyme [Bacteroidales bacterium]